MRIAAEKQSLSSTTLTGLPILLDFRSSLPLHSGVVEHHWVFILFQAPNASSQRLVPLAAFTVHRVTDGVRSIEARNDSAPANDTESTRIPVF